ncbi:hypothetical protein N1937_09560 [Rhizobium sp. WSM4643]|nr:hypothetical protein [Rhizobium laguerreae]UWM77441.1 hypothetical protein N1937_09560 [Rhizobium leguminosarum bv. viciae]
MTRNNELILCQLPETSMCGIGQREAQLLRQRRKAAAHVKNTHGLDPLNVSLRSLSDEEGLGALLSLEMMDTK